MVLGGYMKRSRFWRRFVIPESLSARLLNVIAIGTLGLSVVVMCFAPELQEFGRKEMIKPDGSLPFEPLYRLDRSMEEQWEQFFRENRPRGPRNAGRGLPPPPATHVEPSMDTVKE